MKRSCQDNIGYCKVLERGGDVSVNTTEVITSSEAIVRPYSFIDLFCGIGGTRLGFTSAGCKCVFSCDWDRFARQTYEANFSEIPTGDIRAVSSDSVPDHDILVAGFPCQPFSISGVSKKNSLNKPHGFDDPTQGTLFFEIKRILADKKPRAFMLENVKNLETYNRGNNFKTIMSTLRENLGYHVEYRVIDASAVVPQHRERIYIVGFRDTVDFKFPSIEAIRSQFKDVLEPEVPVKYTLTDHLWRYLQDYAEKHRKKGNGFGYGLTDLNGISRTLSARYYKDGSEILIPQEGKNPRRLTPRECARLMGFPDTFDFPVSDTQAYRQFGNSVVVPVIENIAKAMVKTLREQDCLYDSRNRKHTREQYRLFEKKAIIVGKRQLYQFPMA